MTGAHLDRHFGKCGIRYLPESHREATGAALLGDGQVIVGGKHEIARPVEQPGHSGAIDRGPSSTGLESIDFGSAGRMIVTGRAATGTEPLPAKDGGGTGTKSEAFLARIDGSGGLDTSFAGGGFLIDEGINLLPGV